MYKRRILTLIIVCCCFISNFTMLGVRAEPTTQEYISEIEMASRLSQLGMITGNEKGDYMLQSKLKRSEATQFLVNLIGKNKYIKDNKDTYSTTSFNDVKKTDWFAPSVGYCERSGIITVNDTATFRPKDYVSEKEFLGMTLKALGYTTDDFSWSTVYQKAYEAGLVTDSAYQTKTDDNSDFKRGNVVKVMYTALGLKSKSDNMTLIQKMVNEDIITYETAIASKILKDEVISKITEIKPLNEQKIRIVFNEKIGTINPESIQINDTATGNPLTISSITQTDTELVIKTSKQVAARLYSIEIKKFMDYEGNTVSKLSSQFKGFTVVEVVSDLFKISKIEQKDDDEVNIFFTHPVNDNAANSLYYEIYENDSLFAAAGPSDTLIKVLPDNKGITIALKGRKFTADQEYSIRVSNDLISAYGVNFIPQTELDSDAFIAKSDLQSTGFAIEQVIGLSRNTIQVDFSADVDQQIAEQIYMYSIIDSNNKQIQVTSSQMVSGTGKSVLLTINGTLDPTKTYSIMVNYMMDATHQYTMNKQSFTFTGYLTGGVEFQVYNVVPIDTSSIDVTFSNTLSEKSLSDLSNFTLLDTKNVIYKAVPVKVVKSSEDPCTIRLFFSKDKKLQSNTTYTLRLTTKVTDYTGYSLAAGQNEYTFNSYGIPEVSMSMERAAIISSDTIKVVFSREIAMDTPNILTGNYSVDYYDNGVMVKKVPIAITYIDSKIIVLKFDKLPEGGDSTFSFKEIKDIGGETYSDNQNSLIKVTVAK